jgi:hypothetical protein
MKTAAYYFPNFHVDPANEQTHGPGWTEWDLVRHGLPRFAGHQQPKAPLWGEEDEADPSVMGRKAAVAAQHGINAFVFDWYWYEGRPFLHRALENGFMPLDEHPVNFALMWANHDWGAMHPISYYQAKTGKGDVLFSGRVSDAGWDAMTDYIIKTYFKHPAYWLMDGRPFFSIYNAASLVESFGSLDNIKKKLDVFRIKTEASGFSGLHLNLIEVFTPNIVFEESMTEWPDMVKGCGFDSVTSYSWAHFTHQLILHFDELRVSYDYAACGDRVSNLWKNQQAKYDVPFFPHVTMGWDSSCRTVQSDKWENMGYGPFSYIWENNTPAEFRRYLEMAKDFIGESGQNLPLFINAWNEWPESSYLEPDTVHGYGYLEAVRDVFGVRNQTVVTEKDTVGV